MGDDPIMPRASCNYRRFDAAKGFVFALVLLATVSSFGSWSTSRAALDRQEKARLEELAREQDGARRKKLQDAINTQTVDLFIAQQKEIDELKARK